MYAQEPLEAEPEIVEEPSVPFISDHGDSIDLGAVREDKPELDPLTGMPKIYHASDLDVRELPRARTPGAYNPLAIVGAIGGTIALLGVGGYALRKARTPRKAGEEPLPLDRNEIPAESPAMQITAPALGDERQFRFDWPETK